MDFDLTSTISEFLDRHLVIPLLDFISQHPNMAGCYDQEDVMRAKLDLLSNTGMVDYAIEVHQDLYGTDPPEELVTRRDRVLLALQSLSEEAGPLLKVISDEQLFTQLRDSNSFNLENLSETHGVTPDVIEAAYEFGKFQFDCGSYQDTATLMHVYRMLMNGSNPEREFFALWGKFAADILSFNWDEALEDMNMLREIIDATGRNVLLNPLQQLQHRTWLIHWSLFVFFNHREGRNGIIDLLFSDKYLNTIQTNCPHVLRYLTTAVITNKKRRGVLKDLVKVIQQEAYAYSDPITEFVEYLYVNFDFEGAQDMLQNCENTLKRDFFLYSTLDDFLEDARRTIFETYCRIHQVIDIGMLANKLNMEQDEAEKWVVNLIRNARLDAKIDSQANQVIMGVSVPSVYEQVVDTTKNLLIRGTVLTQNSDRPHSYNSAGFRADDDRRRKGSRRDTRVAA
ncbi:Eukaryotic translation initiation factor 3 subunit E [Gracilariopsis chorda]|uniref:Eukaryotic translation initiation factor 3 subunit E n=1 Tax=Gracilariopsis chorda TaxID=448386 RepID=A0A2V3IHR5_9FLOR|nr:Eukaryotic translation initiation factor 3 subunit E [Gracilariopsis chorda]|eukprot:PXF41612.1 Eukaryotic translation initiation factor 3 subunit E [Gracilariopsis chorda]